MTSSHGAGRRMISDAPTARDFVSDLPMNVIDNIMKRIPLGDAARLSVLSRKWRHIWMSLSHLKFDAHFFKEVLKNKRHQVYEFFSIVSKILLSHDGPIHQLFLHIPNLNYESPEIGQLITFLSRNGVREITLEKCGSSLLKLPSHLFSCVELKSLKLGYCTFSVPPTFKSFKNLTRVELENISFTGDSLGSFISSCPVLENLILKGFDGVGLTIDAPNLKYIEMYGKFDYICLKGCQGLLCVTFDLLKIVQNRDSTKARNLIEFLSGSCEIQELHLRGHVFECLAGFFPWDYSMRTFKYLKKLQILDINLASLWEFPYFVGMIHGCRSTEQLTISFRKTIWEHEQKIAGDPGYRFFQLHSARIVSVNGFSIELKLIEFLLTRSPVLEKLYVQRNKNINTDLELKLSRELMRFCRASSKAAIIYADP